MVSSVLEKSNEAVCEDNPTNKIEAEFKALNIHNEISINDNIDLGNESNDSDSFVEEESPLDQLFYDASDKLKEDDMLDPTTIQLRDTKEIDIPNPFPSMQKRQQRSRQTHTKGQRYMREY